MVNFSCRQQICQIITSGKETFDRALIRTKIHINPTLYDSILFHWNIIHVIFANIKSYTTRWYYQPFVETKMPVIYGVNPFVPPAGNPCKWLCIFFYVYDIISLCVQVRKQFNNTKAGIKPSQKHKTEKTIQRKYQKLDACKGRGLQKPANKLSKCETKDSFTFTAYGEKPSQLLGWELPDSRSVISCIFVPYTTHLQLFLNVILRKLMRLK